MSVLHLSPNEFHLDLFDAHQSMSMRAANVPYRTVQINMLTENDLVFVPFVQSDLPKMQKGLGMLIGVITVARSTNPKYVAGTVEQIEFGADLKGNDARAVETWHPRLDPLIGDPKH